MVEKGLEEAADLENKLKTKISEIKDLYNLLASFKSSLKSQRDSIVKRKIQLLDISQSMELTKLLNQLRISLVNLNKILAAPKVPQWKIIAVYGTSHTLPCFYTPLVEGIPIVIDKIDQFKKNLTKFPLQRIMSILDVEEEQEGNLIKTHNLDLVVHYLKYLIDEL